MVDEILITLTEATLAGDKISAAHAEEMYVQLDIVKKQISRRVLVTGEDRARWKAEDEKQLQEYAFGGEGCDTCEASMPGVIFPIAPDSNTEHAWVEACGSCSTFEGDLQAAMFVGRLLGRTVKIDYFDSEYSGHPYIDGLTFDEAEDVLKLINQKHKELLEAAKEIKHGDEGNPGGLRVHASDQVPHDPE